MRILLITASLPYPPASGGAIRTLGILEGLHAAGHTITLLSFHDVQTDPAATPLQALCERIITQAPPVRTKVDRLRDLLTSRQPDIARRFYSPQFEACLRDLLKQQAFDLVQFEAIESVRYLPIVHEIQPDTRIVFDTFNAEYALQRSMFEIDRRAIRRWPMAVYSYIQVSRITAFEGAMCRMADAVIAVSDEDAALLGELVSPQKIHVIPSGVSVAAYESPDAIVDLAPDALVFTGTMDYRPNVDAMLWFTESVFPRVRAAVPDAQIYIVGKNPHPRLAHLHDAPGITLTGRVDSTVPYLHAAAVYIAPLRMGSGTRLKLLEAMSAGCAIVSTTIAAAGLQSDVKSSMVIADEPAPLADAIVALLKDDARRSVLGTAARQSVARHYDWPVIIPRLLRVYEGIGLG